MICYSAQERITQGTMCFKIPALTSSQPQQRDQQRQPHPSRFFDVFVAASVLVQQQLSLQKVTSNGGDALNGASKINISITMKFHRFVQILKLYFPWRAKFKIVKNMKIV